jgi:Ca2+/Na+ antiporter
MKDHDYIYKMVSLIYTGLIFLILYPLVLGIFNLITEFSRLELIMLILIYLVAAFSIFGLWIYAKSKHVRIEDQQIIFKSILGEYILEPADVRRVVFYCDTRGQEIAQIWTRHKNFCLSKFYFPFPELMTDLEGFIDKHTIRTNFTGRLTG